MESSRRASLPTSVFYASFRDTMGAKLDIREELKSAGTYPTGPCSAYPRERNMDLILRAEEERTGARPTQKNTYDKDGKLVEVAEVGGRAMPGAGRMAKGLLRTAGQAVRNGRVSAEIRKERYDTCKACPLFDAKSKRCTDCGCFMEAKTWVGGNPDMLCPQKKWER